ncbi:hypothetical protein N0V82_002087 [Gnomoniopsis sp. IMI 355080]|nr:hypothetical protein N0V82_002087 [Gnomoniopsis sp. IMI 355080]
MLTLKLITLLPAALLATSGAAGVSAPGPSQQNSTTIPYSTRMLSSIILRQQGLVSSGQPTSTLESGLIALAIQSWLSLYASPTTSTSTNGQSQNGLSGTFSDYVDSVLASLSTTASFTNVTQAALLPLDRLTVAQYDGTVSFLPFMASQPTSFLPSDSLLQIQLLYTNAAHPSGLLAHGYDASKTAVWANNATGASPYVWGRSMGWYLTGLVNAWEVLTTSLTDADGNSVPNDDDDDDDDDDVASQCKAVAGGCDALVAAIQAQFTQLVSVLVRYADPSTGAWWQLPTLPGAPGNYLESSSTALFTFAILKGLRLNLLPSSNSSSSVGSNTNTTTTELLKATALRAYKYTAEAFVVDYGNGTLGYNNTVTVCSLNSTATYEYYVNQPINFNAPLGAAAFSLASLEVERLGL